MSAKHLQKERARTRCHFLETNVKIHRMFQHRQTTTLTNLPFQEFYAPQTKICNVETIQSRHLVSTFHTSDYSIWAKRDDPSYSFWANHCGEQKVALSRLG